MTQIRSGQSSSTALPQKVVYLPGELTNLVRGNYGVFVGRPLDPRRR